MARYKLPPDPRDPETELTRPRLRRQRPDGSEPIPWLWLGLGVLVTVIGILLAFGLASLFLSREPLAVNLPTPTIIRLTAPPSAQPSATSPLPTVTPIPTFTPPPTPDRSTPPAEITTDYYARVANTDGVGVSLRAGPSTDNLRLELVDEGTVIFVFGGPQEGNGFLWWQVRLASGTEGWVAGDFLVPAPQPDQPFEQPAETPAAESE
jgi:hypothetical protein